MNKLAFDPQGVKQHGLVYTTLSRVTNIRSLYLITKLQLGNFSPCAKFCLEIHRLQQNDQYELQFGFQAIAKENYLLICSLNT